MKIVGQKLFIGVSGTIFGIIAILHLLRAVYGWPAEIGGLVAPMWLSWLALLVAGYLALSAFILLRK